MTSETKSNQLNESALGAGDDITKQCFEYYVRRGLMEKTDANGYVLTRKGEQYLNNEEPTPAQMGESDAAFSVTYNADNGAWCIQCDDGGIMSKIDVPPIFASEFDRLLKAESALQIENAKLRKAVIHSARWFALNIPQEGHSIIISRADMVGMTECMAAALSTPNQPPKNDGDIDAK